MPITRFIGIARSDASDRLLRAIPAAAMKVRIMYIMLNYAFENGLRGPAACAALHPSARARLKLRTRLRLTRRLAHTLFRQRG